jgi:hypothetical protein
MEMAIVLHRLRKTAKPEKLHGCFLAGMMPGDWRLVD